MLSSEPKDTTFTRLVALLERMPFTPWWWLARRRNNDRQHWVRHVRSYYCATEPERR